MECLLPHLDESLERLIKTCRHPDSIRVTEHGAQSYDVARVTIGVPSCSALCCRSRLPRASKSAFSPGANCRGRCRRCVATFNRFCSLSSPVVPSAVVKSIHAKCLANHHCYERLDEFGTEQVVLDSRCKLLPSGHHQRVFLFHHSTSGTTLWLFRP